MKPLFRTATLVVAVGVAGLLAGCASNQPRSYQQAPRHVSQPVHTQAPPHGARYGTVVNIEAERVNRGTSGAGAVAGGVIGGVIGNQIGRGSGRALATIAGVVGGAVAGNAIEGQANQGADTYYVTVRFDDGTQQVFTVPGVGDLRRGDRVWFHRGQITRM